MEVIVCKTKEEAGKKVAEIFINKVKEKNNKEGAVLGLATGSTVIPIYENMVKIAKEDNIDFSKVRTYNLDEYVGIDENNENSYRYFMNDNLFNHINIKKENTFVPSGEEKTAEENAKKYDETVLKANVDIQLLGIGENGHIGFNEPNESLHAKTFVENLSENTIEVNSRFFSSIEEVPKKAVTMGIGTILSAKEIIICAFGKKKANAVKYLIGEEKVTTKVPATMLFLHKNVKLFVDEECFSEVKKMR